MCSVLHCFNLLVICAVVLTASLLPIPLCSLLLISSVMMDSGGVWLCIALAGCGLEVIGGRMRICKVRIDFLKLLLLLVLRTGY